MRARSQWLHLLYYKKWTPEGSGYSINCSDGEYDCPSKLKFPVRPFQRNLIFTLPLLMGLTVSLPKSGCIRSASCSSRFALYPAAISTMLTEARFISFIWSNDKDISRKKAIAASSSTSCSEKSPRFLPTVGEAIWWMISSNNSGSFPQISPSADKLLLVSWLPSSLLPHINYSLYHTNIGYKRIFFLFWANNRVHIPILMRQILE